MGRNTIFSFLLLAVCALPVQADVLNSSKLADQCRSLIYAGQYEQAALLQRQLSAADVMSDQESDFLKAVVLANTGLDKSLPCLESFLQKYPESIFTDRVLYFKAWALLSSGDFQQALDAFDDCDDMNLPLSDREQKQLLHSIALFRCGKRAQATLLLNSIDPAKADTAGQDWIFYNAYAAYLQGKNDDARRGMSRISEGRHAAEARLYLAEMDLSEGRHVSMSDIGMLTDSSADSIIAAEAGRISGEMLLADGEAEKARLELEKYVMAMDSLAKPGDRYLLGVSCYRTGDWDAAIKALAPVSEGKGELAQNAALYMGLAALNRKDLEMARMSFQRATLIPGRADVREQALFNYAMVLQESPMSFFGEALSSLETFLNDYPKSEYAARASECLTREYMYTVDYDAALASVSRIKNPSGEILKARQILLYRKAMDLLADGKAGQAVNLFDQSLAAGDYSPETSMDALFWRAEAQYRQGNYSKADQDYARYLGKSKKGDTYRSLANYGRGYVSYRDNNFKQALDFFSTSISGLSDELKADANLRRADCMMNLRKYDDAISVYAASLDAQNPNADYALFQSAKANGLKQRTKEKIALLERIVSQHASSQYVPSALYELGRTCQQTGNNDMAATWYAQLVRDFPVSDLARRASVETALIYYQSDRYDQAIDMYKKVITDYPGSDESRTAMSDLKSIYVELGQTDRYFDFMQNAAGAPAISDSQRDSLSYAAAESMFSRGETATAAKLLADYLDTYKNGIFKFDALYYQSVIFQQDNDYDKAMDGLLEVSGSSSRFSQDALKRASTLSYAAGDWETALDSYVALYDRTSDAALRRECLVRIVSAAGQIGEYDAILDYADKALSSNIKDEQQLVETNYWKAKALLAKGKKDQARPVLEKLSEDTRTRFGAESDYLLSQLLFDSGQIGKAQKNVMSMIEEGTPQMYWLARSFILLSDICSQQGKDVEARQYLLSLQSNYTEDDDIASMIEERLK